MHHGDPGVFRQEVLWAGSQTHTDRHFDECQRQLQGAGTSRPLNNNVLVHFLASVYMFLTRCPVALGSSALRPHNLAKQRPETRAWEGNSFSLTWGSFEVSLWRIPLDDGGGTLFAKKGSWRQRLGASTLYCRAQVQSFGVADRGVPWYWDYVHLHGMT